MKALKWTVDPGMNASVEFGFSTVGHAGSSGAAAPVCFAGHDGCKGAPVATAGKAIASCGAMFPLATTGEDDDEQGHGAEDRAEDQGRQEGDLG